MVGVSCTGPDREVVDVGVGVGGRGLVGRVRRAADDPVRPDRRAGLRGRLVVLADVHAVGAARLDQVRPVVEDEERVVAARTRAPRSTSPSSSSVLSRSWIRSTPPRTAAAIQSRGRAGQTRYRRAVARRSRGVTHQGIP